LGSFFQKQINFKPVGTISGKRYWTFLEQYQKFIEASGFGIQQQLNAAAWILGKKRTHLS
jgi:hypothetical protein